MKNSPKRRPKTVVVGGHMAGEVLTHMRKVAYTDMRITAMNVMRHADRLRDDDGMLRAAEEKRQRKLERNKRHAK